MLITQGERDSGQARKSDFCEMNPFRFTELAWKQFHEDVKKFIMRCLERDVSKRASIQELLQMDLIKDFKVNKLDEYRHQDHTNDDKTSCHNLHTANVLKEIIYRKIYFNEEKEREIYNM